MNKLVLLGLVLVIGFASQWYATHQRLETYRKIDAGFPVENRPGELEVFDLDDAPQDADFSPYHRRDYNDPHRNACEAQLREHALKNTIDPVAYIAANAQWIAQCAEALKRQAAPATSTTP